MKSQIFIIGSNPSVTENEIAIKLTDPNNVVSNSHCRITHDGIDFYIEDLDSISGTFVDGNKITTKTKINHSNLIKFGDDFIFSLMNPIIQNNIPDNSKRTILKQEQYNTQKQFNKISRNDFISNDEIIIAMTVLIIGIILDIKSVFYTEKVIAAALLSLISGLLYAYSLSILKKYFNIFKANVIIKYLNWTITLLIILSFIVFIGDIIEIETNSEFIPGIIPILIVIVHLIIFIILNIKIINFDRDETGHLKQFAYLSIISTFLVLIISFFVEENDIELELTSTIIEIIPTIFLILFFYKLKDIESVSIESENEIKSYGPNISNQIKELFDLKEQGVISEEEFNNKKKELLDKI